MDGPPPINSSQQMNGPPPFNPNQQMNGPPPFNPNQQMNGPPPVNPNQQMNAPPSRTPSQHSHYSQGQVGQPQSTNQVYMQQPHPSQVIMMGPPVLGFATQRMACPYCQVDQSTNVKYECGSNATIWAVLLCVTGLWCCALIPMLSDDCKDVHHSCSSCGRVIGVTKRGC